MKKYIGSAVSLTAICAVVALLLALTNHITAPIIKEQEMAATNKALLEVMPDGKDFKAIEVEKYDLPQTIIEAYSESSGGYVFKMSTSGYASGLVIMCGVDAEGKVTGATYISSNETLGAEKEYGQKLKDADINSIDSVDTITGATMTTEAYRNAVKDALGSAVIIGGGSVDLRSPEEIFADNLNEALPEAEGKFTFVLKTEILDGIDSIYSADNKTGYVFIVGENFVATDNEGKVKTQVEDAIKTQVETAAKKQIESKLTEVDISSFADMPRHVKKVYKTESGNYIFDLEAYGFGINGDAYYNPSGKPIVIKASATESGEIIDCVTVEQFESKGYGEACGKPEFYNQFIGKTEKNYGEIDAISGATLTTSAYKTAISKVFEAIKIIKGGA